MILCLCDLTGRWLAHVELPVSLLTPAAPPGQPNPSAPGTSPTTSTTPLPTLRKESKKKHHLTTATDPIFADLRDLNFASACKRLSKVGHRLDQDYKVNRLYGRCFWMH
jgi:hypothetical protein